MVLAVIAAAAEAAAEHEKSEAPFFIAGGVLAGFAVLISVIGFTRPDFPDSSGAARGVMGLGTVMVIATMAAIIHVSG
jgi:DMSO reductase anchor subunit